jgi:glucokinase
VSSKSIAAASPQFSSRPKYVLAADVGGTKTLVELGVAESGGYRRVYADGFQNEDHAGVAEVVEAFFAACPERPESIDAACFALAGPVNGRRIRLTNLAWEADADALAARLRIAQVRFVNDFAAVGYGITALESAELLTLQTGRPESRGVRAVLGAGTGLGMAGLVWVGSAYRVLPSEGGNSDFAPVNEVQMRLLRYLLHRLGRVWCGAVLSGRGLERIYAFLSEADTLRQRTSGGRAENVPISAAEITTRAVEGSDPRAVSTVNLFLEIYGAVAGNLALTWMAQGGVYIAGGIAPRIASKFTDGAFLRAFRAKGKFADLMQTIPVHLVLSPDVGLRGALALAAVIASSRR